MTKNHKNFKMKVIGILFILLMVYSSSAGCIFFLGPLVPVAYFLPSIGRKLLDNFVWAWGLYAVVSKNVKPRVVSLYNVLENPIDSPYTGLRKTRRKSI